MNFLLAILKKEASNSVTQPNLQNLGPMVLYQLRHGGASHELATNRCDLPSLAKRGRWKPLASLKRYEKGARLLELVSRVAPPRPIT